MDNFLDEIYLNPANTGSLGGKSRLLGEAKKHGITKQQVEEYLQSKDGYTQHKPARKTFARRKVISVDINDQHQMDLADMQKFSEYNDGVKYLLTIIDCFSRFAWAIPIKDKTPVTIINALEPIYQEIGAPLRVHTDKGKEFTSRETKQFFQDWNVKFYTTRNDNIKCALIERFNRTLKERLWLYMTENNNFRYIDIVTDVVKSYNNSVHSTTGFAPELVDEQAAFEIRRKMIQGKTQGTVAKFQIGDYVRISKQKQNFEKGYETNFTEELFQITNIFKKDNFHQYELQDLGKESIDGLFYESELSKVILKEQPFHKISRILRERKYKGRMQYLVRWYGYGPAYDSWEYKDDLE